MTSENTNGAGSLGSETTSGNSGSRGRQPLKDLSGPYNETMVEYSRQLYIAWLALASHARYLSRVRAYLGWLSDSDISGDPLMVHPVLPGHHDAPAGNYLVGRPGHQALPAWHPSFGKQLSFSSPSRRQPSAPRFRRLGRRDPQHTSGPRTYRPRPWRISAVCGRPRSAPQASSSTRRWSRSSSIAEVRIPSTHSSARPGPGSSEQPIP